jgi:hypothetical protein
MKWKISRIALVLSTITVILVSYSIYKSKDDAVSEGGSSNFSSYIDSFQPKDAGSTASKDKTTASKTSDNTVPANTNYIPTIGTLKVDKPNTTGNIIGNNLNGSFITFQDKWIYFNPLAPGSSGLYKSMPDAQTGLVKIDNTNAWFINVLDSWIYYYDIDKPGVWKIRINGNNKTKLFDDEIMQMLVKDDWIYYTKKGPNGPEIYKRKTDSSSLSLITQGFSFSFSPDSRWIYFSRQDSSTGKSYLYRIESDGTNEIQLSKEPLFSAQQYGDWVYSLTSDRMNLSRMKPDGSNKSLVSTDGIISFVIYKDFIYFVSLAANRDGSYSSRSNLYKMSLDGSGKTRLNRLENRMSMMNINITDDWIFGVPNGRFDGSYLYRLKPDGTSEGFIY